VDVQIKAGIKSLDSVKRGLNNRGRISVHGKTSFETFIMFRISTEMRSRKGHFRKWLKED